jgi:DNA/RNA endonuclease YhcR with UshA esterase domain
MKKFGFVLAVTFALLLVSAPIFAHHGEANYDTDHVVAVKGTVTDFQFINPHTLISLDVKNDKGEIEKWSCEARSPSMLVRVGGWDKTTLKVGDVITVYGYKSKNGSTVMRLQKLTLADGTLKDNL